MLTKTKTLIDKYTDALMILGILLVLTIILTDNLTLDNFRKAKATTTVDTLAATYITSEASTLNGNLTISDTSVIGQGFQLGSSASYGTNIPFTPPTSTLGYKSQFGSFGSGDGQFIDPYGIAINISGAIYVVDFGNNRVQKFDNNGIYLGQFGSSGSGDGQFNGPYGVALDAFGNIYVTDSDNDRVQKFDNNGNYLSQFGSNGSGDGQFNGPAGLAIDASGSIYVVDRMNDRVQKFDNNGNYLSQFGSSGSGDGQFNRPAGVAIDASGSIYVVDRMNDRVQKFDNNGNYLSQFGSNGSGDGQFNGPYGVATDTNGNIFVADFNNERIQKFDNNGNYLSQFGSNGSGDGQFNGPYGVALDAFGNIYVADSDNNRVQKFDSSGNYLSQFGSYGGGDGQFSFVTNLAIYNNSIYVVDSYNYRIQVFGPVPVYSTGPYSTQASGLTCGTTYHYRAYVTNAGGTYYGADQTFNTQGCPYVPSASKPTTTVSPNPAPLFDLSVLTAIGRSAFLKQSPGGWLGYIYRFIQSLPYNLTVLLPYLVLIFILVIALIYALEATRERILAILYTRKARHKASALIAEKGVLTNISNSTKLIADKLSNEMKLLIGAGLINKFEQSAINDSTKQIIKQSQVFGWSESSRELAGRQSLHTGGWAKIAYGLVHPLLWAPVLILALVTVGLDLLYSNYGIATVSSADIRLQIIILAISSVVLALVWARLIYNRNTRQNASGELSRAILLMQANAGILNEAIEKNEMQIDEINSITKKLNRKDEAGGFIKARDDLASFVKSLAAIQALNLQEAGVSTSQSITKSINDVLKENKQLIARKKIKTNKKIQPGLKIGLPAALSYELVENNLRNAFKLTDKGSGIDVSLKSTSQKAILNIEYKGLALSRRMLHLLEGPIENYRALDATGTALFVNKIIVESVGGQFDVVSDSKYGTTVRIKLPKSNAKIDKFKPFNEGLDNPELAPFNGKEKPA